MKLQVQVLKINNTDVKDRKDGLWIKVGNLVKEIK